MAHGDLISWFTPISLVDVCTPVLFSKRKESDNKIQGKVSPIGKYAPFIQVPFGYYSAAAGVLCKKAICHFTKS